MGITAITRDWGNDPSIVRMVTTDDYATITAPGYLFAQLPYIEQVNLGPFTWVNDDLILVNYAGNNFSSFFDRDPDTDTLTPANPGPAVTTYLQVPITTTEFKAMYTTPKLILAAPGSNTLIVVDRAALVMTYNSVAYAVGGTVAFQYGNTAHGAGDYATGTMAAAAFNGTTASNNFIFEDATINSLFSASVNKGIYLSNDTAAFTTGNSGFVAHLWYTTILTA